MPNPSTILFATDLSNRTWLALDVARALSQAPGSRLVVLHVVRPRGALVEVGRAQVEVRPGDGLLRLRQALDEIADSDPRVQVERELTVGDPADEILRMACEAGASLIVLGACRWGERKRSFGAESITAKVLVRAPCPVLLVTAPVPRRAGARPRLFGPLEEAKPGK
jgi:nucleotide-binding universal stress UspA family protein